MSRVSARVREPFSPGGRRKQPDSDISNSRGDNGVGVCTQRARPCTALCVCDLTSSSQQPTEVSLSLPPCVECSQGREVECLV